MKIFNTRKALSTYLSNEKEQAGSIGFVPTMGALHQGHLSLISIAAEQNDIVVVSIFVNPTQFNDKKDLERYPRPIEADLEKLKATQCDAVFLPSVDEMYHEDENWEPDLQGLDNILEGEHRPGHFKGVTQIVKKLLDVVKPDAAYFGQKDYQQFLIISKMIADAELTTRLVMCPIIRENDGLAMSSRNIHLSESERQTALTLWQALKQAKTGFETKTISEIKNDAKKLLEATPGLVLEYFEICDGTTLEPAETKNATQIIALVAACVGNTRLIDNIILR